MQPQHQAIGKKEKLMLQNPVLYIDEQNSLRQTLQEIHFATKELNVDHKTAKQ